jgi:hypothetical protein
MAQAVGLRHIFAALLIALLDSYGEAQSLFARAANPATVAASYARSTGLGMCV